MRQPRPPEGYPVPPGVALLMQARGESQTKVARVLGIAQTVVSQRLHGLVQWTYGDLLKLAAHWHVPICELVSGEAGSACARAARSKLRRELRTMTAADARHLADLARAR